VTTSRWKIALSPGLLLLLVGCHPGGYVAGIVTDSESGQPIPRASVRLYYYEARSSAVGCFALGGADALPFQFGVSAPGYKPLVVDAKPGRYEVAVKLAPEGTAGDSKLTSRKISKEKYQGLSRSCP